VYAFTDPLSAVAILKNICRHVDFQIKNIHRKCNSK
jgi:hypothetical protein